MGMTATPTYSVKLRYTFEFFDVDRKKYLTPDDLLLGFKELSLELTTAAVSDIHLKTDINQDGVLCFEEWTGLCEVYPTMMDCMYYRAVDKEGREKKLAEIDAKKSEIITLRESEVVSKKAKEDATQRVTDIEQELLKQTDTIDASLESELACSKRIDAAKCATESSRNDVTASQTELNSAKDRERDTNSAAMEAKRLVETATRRLAMQENRATQSDAIVRDLERQLEDARKNLEAEKNSIERLKGELDDASSRETQVGELHVEAGHQLRNAMHLVGENEANVRKCQADEKEAHSILREQQNATKLMNVQKEHLTETLNNARMHEKLKEQDTSLISRDVDCQEGELMQLEATLNDFVTRRQLTDEEEQPLIEQEVLLRRQRDVLERKEQQLNVQVTSFNDRAQRSSSPTHHSNPGGCFSPSPARSS
eukprot:TRINITY_DN26988_c0_g1_i1.p1 TRINITY_DN26988_c0_g1~~TRINITY_DN26988_c0_g1_i1.p1  ORF type:complete len:441 (+),score=132.95 TRINITY_DN26988_c0_g1_i1:48-1325(+)